MSLRESKPSSAESLRLELSGYPRMCRYVRGRGAQLKKFTRNVVWLQLSGPRTYVPAKTKQCSFRNSARALCVKRKKMRETQCEKQCWQPMPSLHNFKAMASSVLRQVQCNGLEGLNTKIYLIGAEISAHSATGKRLML